MKSTDNFVELSWDAPDDNNSKIIEYTIYLSDKVIFDIGSPDLSIQKSDQLSSTHKFDKIEVIKAEDPLGGFYRL